MGKEKRRRGDPPASIKNREEAKIVARKEAKTEARTKGNLDEARGKAHSKTK